MRNFLGVIEKFRKPSESKIKEWFDGHTIDILCSGNLDIFKEYIEWVCDKGNSVVRIKWSEVINVYVASDKGITNLYIQGKGNDLIYFYIHNRANTRDKFVKYIRQYARLKGAKLVP
ncbi:MAG: hypothetical protein WCY25_00320 [Moheibacter sp.]